MNFKPILTFFESLYNGLLRTIGWWMLIAGLGCLLLAYSNPFGTSKDFNDFLTSIGSAILSGGVFAVILKSLQFIGVFRQELSDIIYDTKFLERRKDVEEIWRKVSKVLYQSKFPEISEKIENRVLNTYFPTAVNSYYDSLNQSLDIEFEDATKQFIVVAEDLEFTIKATSKSDEVTLPYQSLIFKVPADTKTAYKLLEIKVNGQDKKSECSPTIDREYDNGKAVKVNFSLKLKGEKEYRVKMVHQKTYNPDVDNTKIFNAARFINGIELLVKHPSDLEIRFFPMGTHTDFVDLPGNSDDLLRKKYSDLIFPNQGYRLLLARR